MIKDIVTYWSQLTGNVHPDDERIFRRRGHQGFNLDYPPPAFIGDIANAPVVILLNHGGYDADMTPREFVNERASDEYRAALASSRPLDQKISSTSPYYLERNYAEWLIEGKAAIVNAVAYRVTDKAVADPTAKLLPSALYHQEWLREVLLPQAKRGERFVIVHHTGWWRGATDTFKASPTAAVFSSAPINKDLTGAEYSAAQDFLARR